jgi:curved DNA-binding protein CbpA
VKDYYQLLEIAAGASADEVKRAFRAQIAKYHPDKVHHLGKEFQEMAADRAAELTEAYRILSDDGRRADYDRARLENGAQASGGAASAPPPAESSRPRPAADSGSAAAPPPPPPPEDDAPPRGAQFTQERASRDQYVRKATVGRFRQALDAIGGDYDEASAPGFDLALVPKRKLFGTGKKPKLLGRFVPLVDRQSVADAWAQAGKWSGADEVCVFLMGSSLAAAGELGGEIANQRRRQPKGKLTLIPVDARTWDAHMPLDAPAVAKSLLARLKSGT